MAQDHSFSTVRILGWLALLIGGSLTAWIGWNNTFWGLLGMGLGIVGGLGLVVSLVTAAVDAFRQPRAPRSGEPAPVARGPFMPPAAAPPAARPAAPAPPPPEAARPVTPVAPGAPVAPAPSTVPATPRAPDSPGLAFERAVIDARVPRDYDQRVKVLLRNTSSRPITVAARAARTFEELPADIVGRGSVDEPVVLAPGASLTLELAVTAPDAVRDSYEIPIEAGGASTVVRVQVERPELKLAFRITERNPITLAATFEIRNDGETVGDLAVMLAGDEDNVARLEPSASHAHLEGGRALTFSATPLLYVEFERATVNVECRAAGQLRSFPLQFVAPAGRRLLGVRTGCGHHSHSFDWICTNRPNIALTLFGPGCLGEYYDDVLEMIRDAIHDAGLDPFIDAYRVVSPFVHTALDLGGMLEGPVGVAADALNTTLYAVEGDWENAAISATAMIPLIGQGATASKYGIKLTREAAERLGRKGLAEVFQRAKTATRAAGDVHHVVPPYRPKSAASAAPGSGVSRMAGGPPTPPRGGGSAGGSGPDAPGGSSGGSSGGGRPPDGDPPGGGSSGGGDSPGGGPKRSNAATPDAAAREAEDASRRALDHAHGADQLPRDDQRVRQAEAASIAAADARAAADRARELAGEAADSSETVARAESAARRAKTAEALAQAAADPNSIPAGSKTILDQLTSQVETGRDPWARQIVNDLMNHPIGSGLLRDLVRAAKEMAGEAGSTPMSPAVREFLKSLGEI